MHVVKWIGVIIAMLLGINKLAYAQLDTWTTWSTDQPYVSKQVPPFALVMRGIGTDAYYPVEVNPTTGAIPVALSGGTITIDYSGPTGDPVPDDAAFVGGVDGSGDLRGLKVDTSGELQIDVVSSALPSGAATAARQDTGNTSLSSIDTKTPALGQAVMASSSPVVIASNQTDLPVAISTSSTISVENLPTTVDTNAGANSASTLRVTEGSRAYADSFNKDYAGGNVTTSAWTELIATTAAAINLLCLTDTSGQVMELGTGANPSETRVFLIAQGWSGCIPLRIAAGTRVSVKAVTGTASSGYLTLSGMN